VNGPESPPRLRLSAAPGSALAAGLSAARARGPSDAQLRALEAGIVASLGAAAASAGLSAARGQAPAPGVAPVFASAGALKLAAVVVALAAAASGVTMFRHRQHRDVVQRSSPVATAPFARLADPPAPPAPIAPAGQPLPVVEPRVTRAEHPGRTRHGADELALIARAQRSLASDPAAALALVEDNRRLLAQSSFAQEAEVIAVAALARLGRTDEAAARAARFVARFPDSVHAARMRRVAAIGRDAIIN